MCQTFEKFDLESDEIAVASLRQRNYGMRFVAPNSFYYLRCDNITLERLPLQYEQYTLRLQHANDSRLQQLSGEYFMNGDPHLSAFFQHHIINGAGMLGLAFDRLLAQNATRILTQTTTLDTTKATFGSRTVVWPVHSVRIETLYIATPAYLGEDGLEESEWPTRDMYRINGSVVMVDTLFDKLNVPRTSLSERKLVLYLERTDRMKRSVQLMSGCRRSCNCSATVTGNAFVSQLRRAIDALGFEFRVFQHASLAEDRALFRSAHTVFGPHGGAFSNIFWMQRESNVIEINNGERLCYPAMCLESALTYWRYRAIKWVDYESPMHIDADDFTRFVGDVLTGRSPTRLNCSEASSLRQQHVELNAKLHPIAHADTHKI